MFSLKEYTQQTKQLEELEEIELMKEENDSSTSTTDNVDMGDAKPLFKKTKFLGHPCVEVDDETYTKCILGKQPYSRWSKFIENEDLRSELKQTFDRNKRVLMKNSQTGTMVYVK